MTELLDILRGNPSCGEEGLTTCEILELMGKTDSPFHRRVLLSKIKTEIKAGRVVCGSAIRMRVDGKLNPVPVYRVKG